VRVPVEPPRLPADLDVVEDGSLGDAAEFEQVEFRGELTVEPGAADVELSQCRLVGVDLTSAEFDGLRLTDVVLDGCQLAGAVLAHTSLWRVTLVDCRLSGLVATGLDARHVRISACRADGVNLRASRWETSVFEGVDLTEADFGGAHLSGAVLRRCDLTNADLSKATLTGTALHGSVLEGVRGGEAFRGAVIGSDQVVSVAMSVFAAVGIRVDDDAGSADPA
jgi:uncharacterized protein YjbI with pentapeptide repeats